MPGVLTDVWSTDLYGTPASGLTLKSNTDLSFLFLLLFLPSSFSSSSSSLSPHCRCACWLTSFLSGRPCWFAFCNFQESYVEKPQNVEFFFPAPPLKNLFTLPCLLNRGGCILPDWCLFPLGKVWLGISKTVNFYLPSGDLFSFTYSIGGDSIRFTRKSRK